VKSDLKEETENATDSRKETKLLSKSVAS